MPTTTKITTPNRPTTRRANSLAFFGLVLMSLFVASCSGALVDKTIAIEEKIWKDQAVTFDFEVTDTSRHYDLVLYLTHDDDFAYQNLYARLTVNFPPPNEARVNPLSMQLSDEQGNWYGQCSGGSCTIPLAFMTNTKFQYIGKHSLVFQQYSRALQVEGVEKLRLQVVASAQ